MFSYHSNSESTVSAILHTSRKDCIPIWMEGPADLKDDMYDRYELHHLRSS
jgi:hypothetical protein